MADWDVRFALSYARKVPKQVSGYHSRESCVKLSAAAIKNIDFDVTEGDILFSSGGIAMEYGIRELSEMAGVSARTLRWYDRIGLLRPCRVGENGYRFYSSAEVDRLQHILFYRELGLELRQIGELLDDPQFDRMTALREHLAALESRREQLDGMIASLRRTISAEERNETVMDREKFEAFKRGAIEKNEAAHGQEVRARYGDEAMDSANRRVMNLTQEEYAEWKDIGDEILRRLEAAVTQNADPSGPEGRAIAELHKKWLSFSWEKYSLQAHKGLAQTYVLDERFARYYDRAIPGCAEFLKNAIANL